MSTRARREEHEAAVARRLQLLGEELAGVRSAEPVWPLPETHTRVRAPATDGHLPGPVSADQEPGAVVPVPGRHAARRSRLRSGRDWVPQPLRGRVALGPGPLAVVAVLVALGLAVTAWWVVRSEPVAVAPPAPADVEALAAPAPAPSGPAAALTGGEAPDDAAETVTVDVAGKVRRPGIVVLESGSRVVDALREAGGARPGVDLAGLNLARLLVDGEQVVVGLPPPATGLPVPGAVAAPAAPSATGALVDLNTADLTALESLPEVGPVTAQAIVTWRDTHGGFTAVSELLEVDGIGEATLATLSPFVTV